MGASTVLAVGFAYIYIFHIHLSYTSVCVCGVSEEVTFGLVELPVWLSLDAACVLPHILSVCLPTYPTAWTGAQHDCLAASCHSLSLSFLNSPSLFLSSHLLF